MAKMIGRAAMLATISRDKTPPPERPRKMSAPGMISASVRASVARANGAFHSSMSSGRPS